MTQAYIVKVELPYGLEVTDKGKVSELIPLKVAVLARSRTEAFAMAADALAFITESNGVELRGLTIESIYPIVGGVTPPQVEL